MTWNYRNISRMHVKKALDVEKSLPTQAIRNSTFSYWAPLIFSACCINDCFYKLLILSTFALNAMQTPTIVPLASFWGKLYHNLDHISLLSAFIWFWLLCFSSCWLPWWKCDFLCLQGMQKNVKGTEKVVKHKDRWDWFPERVLIDSSIPIPHPGALSLESP